MKLLELGLPEPAIVTSNKEEVRTKQASRIAANTAFFIVSITWLYGITKLNEWTGNEVERQNRVASVLCD